MRLPLATLLIVLAVLPGSAVAAGHGKKHEPSRFDLPNAVRARPDDASADPPNTHKWTGPESPQSPACGGHFCVHFTVVGADASDKAYAQQLDNVLETEVYPCENGTGPGACGGSPGLGWRDPAPDAGLGGSDKTDIYIEDLFSNEKVFGYTAVDPGQVQDPSVPHHGYMVMDKDYTRYGDGSAASGLAAERVTAAHEYNHVLQNAYDYLEDSWMFEATAVYAEEKVYPDNNDYLNYVQSWVANTKQPMTAFPSTNTKAYGSAVWNHWLEHRYGAVAVRQAWEDSIGSANFAPAAYGAAISSDGGAGFSDEFDRFSAAVAEWNAPGAGFPDHYPDVGRDGTLPVGTQTEPFGLLHTTFSFFDVPIPADAPPVIRLTGTLPVGTAGAVALVARTGADPNAGTVTTNLTPMPTGGTAAVQLDNPAQYGRITAVIVNSDPTTGGFDQQADDYIFIRDATGVVVAMAEPGAPIPVTGPATALTDHGATVNGLVDPHLIDSTWHVEYGRTVGYGSRSADQSLPASTVGAASVLAKLTDLRARTTYHYRIVATNNAGTTAGRDATFTTARDVTKPKLTIKVKRQHVRSIRARGLLYLARCSEHCSGTVELVRSGAVDRKLKLPLVIGKSHLSLERKPASTTLRVRLTRRAKRLLLGRHRGVRAVMRVTVRDDAGNRIAVVKRLVFAP